MKNFIILLKKIDERLTRLEEAIVALLLFIVMTVIFIAVIERFLLQMGITWIEEFARYISVWAAFIGSSLAVKKCAHIGIEAFVQMLPARARRVEDVLVDAIGLAFSIVVVVVGFGFLSKLVQTNQLSPALRIHVSWAYSAVPVGFFLMSIHYFVRFATGLFALVHRDESASEA